MLPLSHLSTAQPFLSYFAQNSNPKRRELSAIANSSRASNSSESIGHFAIPYSHILLASPESYPGYPRASPSLHRARHQLSPPCHRRPTWTALLSELLHQATPL